MSDHLFRDIFKKFSYFFHTGENKESRLLYDISFGFIPRQFDTTEDDKVIYDEEDEVPEMYFILEGCVGIGYKLIANGRNSRS
jgi:hypothetical protein